MISTIAVAALWLSWSPAELERASARVRVGPSIGRAYGGHVVATTVVVTWPALALELGGLGGVHGYRLPGRGAEGHAVSGIDLSLRGGLVLGPRWRLVGDRVGLSTAVYTAASWRHQVVRLVDARHKISARSQIDRVAWEHGGLVSIDVLIRSPWRVSIDTVVPVFWSGASGIRRAWWWSAPVAGIAIGYEW